MSSNLKGFAKFAAWIFAVILIACAAVALFWGPPWLARKHPLTWQLNFQENAQSLAEGATNEEDFIDALRRRGFEITMRPEQPVKGNVTSFVDREAQYTNYPEFVVSSERFQAALPEGHRIIGRSAKAGYGMFPCYHTFKVSWRLEAGEIIDVRAGDYQSCI